MSFLTATNMHFLIAAFLHFIIAADKGISLKNISGRLGHSQTSITGDIYTHFLKSADREAADKMDGVLDAILDNKTKQKQA